MALCFGPYYITFFRWLMIWPHSSPSANLCFRYTKKWGRGEIPRPEHYLRIHRQSVSHHRNFNGSFSIFYRNRNQEKYIHHGLENKTSHRQKSSRSQTKEKWGCREEKVKLHKKSLICTSSSDQILMTEWQKPTWWI